jgi:DNA-directed RNA polymerase specialized sigma24 family protein
MQNAEFVTGGPVPEQGEQKLQKSVGSHYTTAFAELDEAHRVVLFLHYVECLSLYQIARVLNDTEEHVRAVYLGAIERLGGCTEQRDAA